MTIKSEQVKRDTSAPIVDVVKAVKSVDANKFNANKMTIEKIVDSVIASGATRADFMAQQRKCPKGLKIKGLINNPDKLSNPKLRGVFWDTYVSVAQAASK